MLNVTDYFIIALSLLAIYFFRQLLNSEPPVFNVYRKPSTFYIPKLSLIYIILQIRKLKRRLKSETVPGELESPQELFNDKKAVDGVYFAGGNKEGDFLITGMARRHNKLVDGFLLCKIKKSKLGILESFKMPSTELYQVANEEGFVAEGIQIKHVADTGKWRLTYNGKMKQSSTSEKTFRVQVDLEWSSDMPKFDFDTDMDIYSIASATAKEIWSRNYFNTLKKIHQTHHEQFGDLKGNISIDGKSYSFNIETVRDHTVGVREWRLFHRYCLHYFSNEYGDRFAVGIVSMPVAYSALTIGHAYIKKEDRVYPVQSCDLRLYQHGENRIPPEDYAFTFKAGGAYYTTKVKVKDSTLFYISKDWESKIFERLCSYTVNGVKGWGISEWQYRNVNGKDDYIEIAKNITV